MESCMLPCNLGSDSLGDEGADGTRESKMMAGESKILGYLNPYGQVFFGSRRCLPS